MKQVRWFTLLLIITLIITSLSGCHKLSNVTEKNQVEESTRPTTIAIRAKGDPASINFNAQAHGINNLLYALCSDPIVLSNPNTGKYEPRLSESWEVSDDGLLWTFHLRKGLTWHDGELFTTDDVIFSFDYWNNGNFTYPCYWGDPGIGMTFTKVDDNTFTIAVPQPSPSLLGYLSTTFNVIPKHIWGSVPQSEFLTSPHAEHPIGIGAFKFVEYKIGEYAKFEAFDDYWNGRPEIDNLYVRIIPDDAAALSALEAGEISYLKVSASDFERLKDNEKFRIYTSLATSQNLICMNHQNIHLKDLKVRQALSHLIDYDTLINQLYNGKAVARHGLFPKGVMYENENACMKYDFSIDKAKKLLEEDGYTMGSDGIYKKNGKKLELELLFSSGNAVDEQMTLILQSYFAQAGIKLNLKQQERSRAIELYRAKQFDTYLNSYSLGIEPSLYQLVFQDNFSSEELDNLWAQGIMIMDDTQRREIYEKIQKLYTENAVALWLIQRQSLYLCDKSLSLDEAQISGDTEFIHWDKLKFE